MAGTENKEIVIEIKDLVVRYKTLKQMSIRKSLFSLKKADKHEHEAIAGISFNVTHGEIIGVIGKNGSGKSTLLKAIAGIFSPDEGSIDLHNHSVSLIAIGKGFNKNLTGRENIKLTGMLLGFSKEQIEKEIPRIIKFADIGHFIDMPVKTYSSGMFSKLSFSINTILLTDIILIDEVLSVGDAQFKKKSGKRMKKIINSSKRTVIMVTHSMQEVRTLANRVIWMQDGKIMMMGDPNEVVDAYLEATTPPPKIVTGASFSGNKSIEINKKDGSVHKHEENKGLNSNDEKASEENNNSTEAIKDSVNQVQENTKENSNG